jgi:outer membrane receptor protein involved in Fe transport
VANSGRSSLRLFHRALQIAHEAVERIEWRLNLGVDRDAGDYFWNVTLNYQDESYWSDVLFARATTDAFTQVNAAIGWRFRNERLTLKLIGQNLFDEDVQQHIFGDLIGRRVQGQIGFEF